MRNVLLLLSLICAAVHPVAAQQGRPTRVPVTVALTDGSALRDAPFRILRRADTSPRDIILLPAGADAAALSRAVAQLQMIRRVQGDTASASGAMMVRRSGNGGGSRMLPWAPRVLRDLHRMDARPLAGVGTVKSIQIWLPPTRKGRPGA